MSPITRLTAHPRRVPRAAADSYLNRPEMVLDRLWALPDLTLHSIIDSRIKRNVVTFSNMFRNSGCADVEAQISQDASHGLRRERRLKVRTSKIRFVLSSGGFILMIDLYFISFNYGRIPDHSGAIRRNPFPRFH